MSRASVCVLHVLPRHMFVRCNVAARVGYIQRTSIPYTAVGYPTFVNFVWGCPAHERVSRSLVRSTATMRSLATRVLIAAALTPAATAFVTLDWYAAAW